MRNRFENIFSAILPQLDIGIEHLSSLHRHQEKELLYMVGGDASLLGKRKPLKVKAASALKFREHQKFQISRFFIEDTRLRQFGS